MLVDSVEFFRLDANRKLDPERRSGLGQFMTPLRPQQRSSWHRCSICARDEIRLLDAGAGVGSLTAAFVAEICNRKRRPKSVTVSAYEIDQNLCEYLYGTLEQCRQTCERAGIHFNSEVMHADFVDKAASLLRNEIFAPIPRYDCAIMNPPYKKISSDSIERLILREIGVETSNIYAGFLFLVLRLLEPNGELVAITPRSFCNGLYFKPFRKLFLDAVTLRRIHVFESRDMAFIEDSVLQENVVMHARKGRERAETVTVSSSTGPEDDFVTIREVHRDKVVNPSDPEHYIHIVPLTTSGASVAAQMDSLHIDAARTSN